MDDRNIPEANEKIHLALELTGGLVCHECGETRKGKIVVRKAPSGPYVKCYKCGWYDDAIGLLRADGMNFADAIATLLGYRPAPDIAVRPRTPVKIIESFTAALDVALYTTMIDPTTPGIDASGEQWQEHGIDPSVARTYRSVYIADPDVLSAHLESVFGTSRCFDAGLISGSGRWLFAGGHRLVEPHIAPSGMVFGMQLRATGATAKAAREHQQSKGTDHPTRYVPKTLSLRGATPKHLIGYGLDVIAGSSPSTVHIVEGFKDVLAMACLGMLAYGLPGAAMSPPRPALQVLGGHQVVLSLDNDSAGVKGVERLSEVLSSAGIATEVQLPPEGCDWADVLTTSR